VIKKLVRHGNSWALVIEKPVMELLQWEDSREVEIVTEGRSLIITSVSRLTVDTDPQREKLASARAYAREALAEALAEAGQEREQAEAKAWDALWDEDPGTSG
jgi:antitoxin component of MazEF toxin-antitoxin module